MRRRPPRSTRTATLVPYTPRFRSFDFTGFEVPDGGTVATYEGIAKQWRNGNGGRVYGAEGALSLPFATFSGALDGFGVLASGSYTKSSVREGGAAPIRSEEHTSELQSLMRISYAVFCLQKKKKPQHHV